MTKDLNALLEAYELTKYAEAIKAVARDAIHIELAAANGGRIPLGASKMGGLPDLPEGVQWFRHKQTNTPLSFVCQINFAEAAPYDKAHMLPDHGILYFFYDCSMDMPWGFDPKDGDAKALYYYDGDLSTLRRASEPKDLKGNGGVFAPAQMRFEHTIDLPDLESFAGEKLPLGEDDVEKYFEILDSAPEIDNKLLGHSNNIQGGMEIDCEYVSHGLYCGDGSGYREGKRLGLNKNAGRWNLLIQVDSNDDLGMMWGDAGRLYVWITDEDLKAGNFEASWVILQCG